MIYTGVKEKNEIHIDREVELERKKIIKYIFRTLMRGDVRTTEKHGYIYGI